MSDWRSVPRYNKAKCAVLDCGHLLPLPGHCGGNRFADPDAFLAWWLTPKACWCEPDVVRTIVTVRAVGVQPGAI